MGAALEPYRYETSFPPAAAQFHNSSRTLMGRCTSAPTTGYVGTNCGEATAAPPERLCCETLALWTTAQAQPASRTSMERSTSPPLTQPTAPNCGRATEPRAVPSWCET